MWQTFDKAQYSRRKPAVSVSSRGLTVNKAAVLLLLVEVPDTHLDFVVFVDREASLIGLRLQADGERWEQDLFPGRRPRTGRMEADGTRRFTNTWRISNPAIAAAASLRIGRYEARLNGTSIHPGPAMIVFGPEPLGS